MEDTTNNKIILKNKSVLYFGSKSIEKDTKLSTLLIDEIDEFNEKNNFFNILYHNKGCKLLMNCTDFEQWSLTETRRLFSKYGIPLHIDHYRTDEEISFMLRRKKIEKIKTIILK